MTDLRGKHVIVTGGSEGIGAAAARQAASSGARVSLVARRESTLRSTAQSIGAAVEWASCDVGDAAATHHALEHLERRQGPCDVLVACAGIVLPGRFLEVPLEESTSTGGSTSADRSRRRARCCRGWSSEVPVIWCSSALPPD